MVLFLLLIAISIILGAYFIETAIVISHSNILIALIGNEDSLPGNVRTKTSSACTKLRYPFRRFAKENNHMRHSVLCFSLLFIILACLCVLKMKVKRTHCGHCCAEAVQAWSGVCTNNPAKSPSYEIFPSCKGEIFLWEFKHHGPSSSFCNQPLWPVSFHWGIIWPIFLILKCRGEGCFVPCQLSSCYSCSA